MVSPASTVWPWSTTASHDTTSAVAGTPLLRPGRHAVYISCGTWALVGCEVPSAVTTPAALAANVTNELGVGGRIRLLKNVTGLWLLEQCRDTWRRRGEPADLATLLAEQAADEAGGVVFDPDDPVLAAATAMPDAIAATCGALGERVPSTPAAVAR